MQRVCAFLTLCAYALLAVAAEPADLPVLLHEDFQKGADRWEPSDKAAWKIIESKQGPAYNQFAQSKYKPPHRSPLNFALLKDVSVGDFILDAKC